MFASLFRRLCCREVSMAPRRARLARRLSLETLEERSLLAGPEITLFDGLTPIVDGSTAAIDFGSVGQGSVGPTRTFTIRNDGDSTLVLSSLGLPTGFTLIDAPVASLTPRSSDTFTIRLDSAPVGIRTGDITIGSNDTDESVFSFAIQGSVTPNGPQIVILLGDTPLVDESPAVVAFPGVVIDETGTTQTFTVRNDGNQTLALQSITFPAGFNLVGSLPASVAPLASKTFTLRLLSNSTGLKSGQVHVVSNDPNLASFDFLVSGLVTATPTPSLTVLQNFTILTDDSSVVHFGKVILGQTGPSRTFTVRNDGTATLTLSNFQLPTGYNLINGLDTSLEPAELDTFIVQLDSSAVAERTGDITFSSNDLTQSSFSIGVIGNVVNNAPEIRVYQDDDEITSGSATPFVFESASQGKSGAKVTFVVSNFGVKDLTLGDVTVPLGFKQISKLPNMLPPDTFTLLVVQLDTKTAGTKSGEITIATNDADENPFRIKVSGTVAELPPEISIRMKGKKLVDGSTAPIAFGNGGLGQAGPIQVFTVRNDGRAPLTLGSLTVPSGFTLVEGLPTVLGPRASDTFTVQLDTSVLGQFAGEITVVSNDADENPFSFTIQASVVVPAVPQLAVFHGNTQLVSGGSDPIDLGTATFRKKGTTLSLTIRNDGDAFLNLSDLDLPAGFLAKGPAKKLAPNRTTTLQLRLDSRLLGSHSGDVILHSDDPTDPVFVIAVQGTVIA